MSVRTDHLNAVVAVKGDAARKELVDLQRQARKTAQEIKGITDPIEKANKQGQLDKMTARMSELRKQIGLTGLSSKQLNSELARLKQLEGHLVPFTQQWIENRKQIDAVKQRIDQVNAAQRAANPVFSKFKEIVAGFTVATAAMAAATAIRRFAQESLRAYNEAAQAEGQLLHALNGQRDVQERLISQAKELQKTTTYQDDVIIKAQAYLAAQQLTEEQIKKTINAAVQLSAVTGEDLQTTTEKLAATYEGQLGRLAKLDDRFKDLTKEQIMNGGVIDILIEKYRGYAENQAKIGLGPWKQISNTINDLQEKMGKALLPALQGIALAFADFLETVGEFGDAIGKMSGGIDAASLALNWFKTTINVLLSPITLFMKSVTWLTDKMTDLAGKTREVNKEVTKLGGSSSRWTDDVKKAINTIGGLEEKLKSLKEELMDTEIGSARFKELQKEIQKTQNAIDMVMKNSAANSVAATKEQWTAIEQIYIAHSARVLSIQNDFALKMKKIDSSLGASIEKESMRIEQKNEAIIGLTLATSRAMKDIFGLLASNEKKSAKSRHAFAVAQKGVSAAEATILGIMAVQKTLADTKLLFPADVITAAAIGVTTAANVAEILATPIPGYAKGGATDVSGGGSVANKRLAWFGEQGTEYVIPNWMLRDPAIANIAGILEGIRSNGFASGGSTASVAPVNNISINNTDLLAEIRLLRKEVARRNEEPAYALFDFDYWNKTTKKLSRIKDRSGV